MSELERELFEQRLISIANGLDYPRTPDIASAVMARLRPSTRPRFISRKLAWSLAIILVLCLKPFIHSSQCERPFWNLSKSVSYASSHAA